MRQHRMRSAVAAAHRGAGVVVVVPPAAWRRLAAHLVRRHHLRPERTRNARIAEGNCWIQHGELDATQVRLEQVAGVARW